MSNINDIRCKPRLQHLVLTRVRPPCCERLSLGAHACDPCRYPCQPWEKSYMSFLLCMHVHVIPFPQLWGSAWSPFGPPELRYQVLSCVQAYVLEFRVILWSIDTSLPYRGLSFIAHLSWPLLPCQIYRQMYGKLEKLIERVLAKLHPSNLVNTIFCSVF